MKTAEEIRTHRNALRDMRQVPCGCAGTDHEAECIVGGIAMAASERVLSWVLEDGQDKGYQRMADLTNQKALERN